MSPKQENEEENCMLLYAKTQNLSLYYSYELRAALALWQGSMTGSEFQHSADLIEQVLREFHTNKLVTYSTPMRVVDRKATQYLTGEWLPRVAGAVLQYWADVVPRLSAAAETAGGDSESATEGVATEEVIEIHAIPGITIAQFGNIELAKQWIQQKN
jgi:hypothetical protein